MLAAAQQEYTRRMAARGDQRAACDRRRFIVGNCRLIVFIAGVATGYAAFARDGVSGWWLLLPLAAFFALGNRLQAMEREGDRLGRAVGFYRRGAARLGGRWAGCGSQGRRFLDEQHVYARDLDLFGGGSLFELLSQARTRVGEETLAAWLLAPAPAPEIRDRQAAVRELAALLDLREDIAVLGEPARTGVHAQRLAAWGERPRVLTSNGVRWLARGLTIAGGATILLALLALAAALAASYGDERFVVWTGVPVRAYLAGAMLIFGVASWRFHAGAEAIFLAAEEAAHDVGLLAEVLARLEQELFDAPKLARLRADLDTGGRPPSRRIAALERLMEFVYQRDNMLVRIIGPLLLWDVHLAYALEDWRAVSGPGMRRWLRAVGEVEALSSIAAYHYEHPDDVLPEVVDEGGPRLEAVGLSHPLLRPDAAVANDVSLGGDGPRVLVVSGSNMSGKSTLLRSIGVAAVMAQAGAPVRAAGLSLSALSVGASIRVSDSLQEGESRFYAEIRRLGAIVRRAEERQAGPTEAGAEDTGSGGHRAGPAVLFLIDEFLHGTNSHDRRIGSEAIVKGLVERGAIGLVTTHDLALTHIAANLGERGANVHFEDHLEKGKMRFDFRLRPGIVRHSNALELMRSVGLDV